MFDKEPHRIKVQLRPTVFLGDAQPGEIVIPEGRPEVHPLLRHPDRHLGPAHGVLFLQVGLQLLLEVVSILDM